MGCWRGSSLVILCMPARPGPHRQRSIPHPPRSRFAVLRDAVEPVDRPSSHASPSHRSLFLLPPSPFPPPIPPPGTPDDAQTIAQLAPALLSLDAPCDLGSNSAPGSSQGPRLSTLGATMLTNVLSFGQGAARAFTDSVAGLRQHDAARWGGGGVGGGRARGVLNRRER